MLVQAICDAVQVISRNGEDLHVVILHANEGKLVDEFPDAIGSRGVFEVVLGDICRPHEQVLDGVGQPAVMDHGEEVHVLSQQRQIGEILQLGLLYRVPGLPEATEEPLDQAEVFHPRRPLHRLTLAPQDNGTGVMPFKPLDLGLKVFREILKPNGIRLHLISKLAPDVDTAPRLIGRGQLVAHGLAVLDRICRAVAQVNRDGANEPVVIKGVVANGRALGLTDEKSIKRLLAIPGQQRKVYLLHRRNAKGLRNVPTMGLEIFRLALGDLSPQIRRQGK
ncbi:hypothetical protein D3C87_1189100 [compost metagenome]